MVEELIKENPISTNILKFVFRHFPSNTIYEICMIVNELGKQELKKRNEKGNDHKTV